MPKHIELIVLHHYSQVQAMLDIIKHYNWDYVKLLFSDTAYGIASAREFLRIAPKQGETMNMNTDFSVRVMPLFQLNYR